MTILITKRQTVYLYGEQLHVLKLKKISMSFVTQIRLIH